VIQITSDFEKVLHGKFGKFLVNLFGKFGKFLVDLVTFW